MNRKKQKLIEIFLIIFLADSPFKLTPYTLLNSLIKAVSIAKLPAISAIIKGLRATVDALIVANLPMTD